MTTLNTISIDSEIKRILNELAPVLPTVDDVAQPAHMARKGMFGTYTFGNVPVNVRKSPASFPEYDPFHQLALQIADDIATPKTMEQLRVKYDLDEGVFAQIVAAGINGGYWAPIDADGAVALISQVQYSD